MSPQDAAGAVLQAAQFASPLSEQYRIYVLESEADNAIEALAPFMDG